jgi:hypothetical protein
MRYGLNLDPESWKLLAHLVADLTWTSVPFDKLHASVVPKAAGVYLICASPPVVKSSPFNQLLNVLYTGLSTSSIQSRFLYHCKTPDEGVLRAKRCYGYISAHMSFYFSVTTAATVADIECRIIDCFGPPCNRQSGISPVITAILGEGKPAG